MSIRPPTTPEQIDVWRSSESETEILEFKEAKEQYDKDKLHEYCVAIANEGGGVILFGIQNNPPRRIVGTKVARDPFKFAQQMFDHLKFRVDVEVVSHPDGRVVVFHVPPRPRGTPYGLNGKFLMRSGESLVPMSEDRLRAIFDEGKTNWLDEYAAKSLLVHDVVKLLDTGAYFSLLNLPDPTDDFAAVSRLEQDGLVDCTNGIYAIKRYAAILLARRLEGFADLHRRAPRIVVYNDNSELNTKLERSAHRGYAVGFRNLITFIGDQLPQNEVIENAVRRKVKLIPDVVIRELVANALIHQDFGISGASVMVEIYTDRVEISNPGTPAVPITHFIDTCQSRNEHLAVVMRRLGFCEEKGSGIDRVVKWIEMMQLPAPVFREGHQSTIVTIFGPRDFRTMGREDRIRACYQHCVLHYVMAKPVTNQTLRRRFNLPESKSAIVSQIIASAMEAKLIRPDEAAGGSKKFARYLPIWA